MVTIPYWYGMVWYRTIPYHTPPYHHTMPSKQPYTIHTILLGTKENIKKKRQASSDADDGQNVNPISNVEIHIWIGQ
jgi:hypothetical protein